MGEQVGGEGGERRGTVLSRTIAEISPTSACEPEVKL